MKLLKNEKTDTFQEIEIEYAVWFVKWKVKYRKINGNIYIFKPPNNYFPVGIAEYFETKDLFEITV